jgi:hypothetical protein
VALDGLAHPGGGEDLVLRPEPGEGEDPGDRQPADDERQGGDGHELLHAAHEPHVLLVLHPVHDGSGAEEHEGLEEGVGDHVEDGRHVGADADGQEHVAELRDGGVGENPFDVEVDEGDGGRHQRRDGTDPGHDVAGRRSLLQERMRTDEQVHAGGHHRGRVDEGRHGGGPLHGVGQPHEQRALRTLAGGRDVEEQSDGGRRAG